MIIMCWFGTQDLFPIISTLENDYAALMKCGDGSGAVSFALLQLEYTCISCKSVYTFKFQVKLKFWQMIRQEYHAWTNLCLRCCEKHPTTNVVYCIMLHCIVYSWANCREICVFMQCIPMCIFVFSADVCNSGVED